MINELAAIEAWLERMQATTGLSPDQLLSFGPVLPLKQRKILLAKFLEKAVRFALEDVPSV